MVRIQASEKEVAQGKETSRDAQRASKSISENTKDNTWSQVGRSVWPLAVPPASCATVGLLTRGLASAAPRLYWKTKDRVSAHTAIQVYV